MTPGALVRLVARAPVPIHRKLAVALAAVVALLITVGVLGVHALGQANGRAETLGDLQRKVSVYRQLQNDTTVKLQGGASVQSDPDPAALDAALRRLHQSYDFSRLEFVARDEGELLTRIEASYDRFVAIVAGGIELVRQGRQAEGKAAGIRAKPLADQLERLINQLVNKAEADIANLVDENDRAYRASRRDFIAVALGGVALALVLGLTISRSIVAPVTEMNRRLGELAAGDFSGRVEVANRDELGTLAANLNRMNDELGRLYSDMEAANRHKSAFLANMSHELRTPLNVSIRLSRSW